MSPPLERIGTTALNSRTRPKHQELLLATSNAGKVNEFRLLLPEYQLIAPADLGLHLNVVEDGTNYYENAKIKATAFARASGRVCLADDSGLEVDALNNEPGIFSARYGGITLNDEGRCNLVLSKLVHVPDPPARSARFLCSIVAVSPDGRSCKGEGICEGQIAIQADGKEGFGYDPIFWLPQLGRTMAELSATEKNHCSHRRAALRELRPRLTSTFPELKVVAE